jgi:hypothetical protein
MRAVDERLRGAAEVVLPPLARELGVTRFALMRHRDRHLTAAVDIPSIEASQQQLHQPDGIPKATEREASSDDAYHPNRVSRSVRANRRRVGRADVKQKFLEAYRTSGNLSHSAAVAGVGRRTVYTWQEIDEQFSLQMREAENEAVELLEQEARTRATSGAKLIREVWRGDRMIERIVEYRPSDTVLVKLLQALRPDKYGDKLSVTQTQVVKTVEKDIWDAV